MERNAPDHVVNYCYNNYGNLRYDTLSLKYENDYSFVYQIKCSCNSLFFRVFMDEHPTIVLHCKDCGTRIEVYDLKYYTCAIKLKEELQLKCYKNNQTEYFKVFVVYEYSDDFEQEKDVEFSSNDITWCCVYVENIDGQLIQILNDETV